MIKIAICDDEKIFRNSIKNMVESYLNTKNILSKIDVYSSGENFLKENSIEKYDIIFLDINMKEINGIEIAKKMRQVCKRAFLVFVTAFIDYSLEGYKVDAIRYIIKDNESLKDALYESMDAIFDEMSRRDLKLRFEFIEGIKVVSVDKIIYVESNLHKLMFYIKEGERKRIFTLYSTLNKIEENFSKKQFIRIHQSYLVNVRYIANIKNYKAILLDGTEFSIPKSRYKDVKDIFISYKGSL